MNVSPSENKKKNSVDRVRINKYEQITPLWRAIENRDITYTCRNYAGFRHFLELSSVLPQAMRLCQGRYFSYSDLVEEVLCHGDWEMHGFKFLKLSSIKRNIEMIQSKGKYFDPRDMDPYLTSIYLINQSKRAYLGSLSHMKDAILLRLFVLLSDLGREEVSYRSSSISYAPELLKTVVKKISAYGCADDFAVIIENHQECEKYILNLISKSYENGELTDLLLMDDGSSQEIIRNYFKL